jgi:acyl-CoA dehydrogenase
MTAPVDPDYRAIGRRVARDVAAAHAADVDHKARFPEEAFAALREERLLSAMVPVELGGLGASVTDMAAVTEELAHACSSTAMVFAMHQIQIAILVRHGRSEHLLGILREISEKQMLCASATTEVGIGGDTRSSLCAVEVEGGEFELVKQAPVISYAEASDLLLVTARRTPDSPPGDQVLVVLRTADTALEPTTTWDTLGFRGTCSPGFVLRGRSTVDAIASDLYTDISSRTMLPVAHVLWGHVWFGMASAAFSTARAFVRAAARSNPGTTPPGAARLAELSVVHQQMGDVVRSAALRYEEAKDDAEAQGALSFAIAMNNVKVSASTQLLDVIGRALVITGIMAYREDSPYSMGRLLRDAWGAPLMVNNDRILGNSAQLLLVSKD